MAVVVLLGWYLTGLAVARRMVQRGHSPVPWWTGAMLLGALLAVPALVATRWRDGTRVPPVVVDRGQPSDAGFHLLLLDRPEHLSRTLEGTPTSIARSVARCTDVAVVGHEGRSRWIDTGELGAAARALRRDVRPMNAADVRLVTSSSRGAFHELADAVGDVDLVATSSTGSRTDADRLLALGAELHTPVLVVGPGVSPSRSARAVSPWSLTP